MRRRWGPLRYEELHLRHGADRSAYPSYKRLRKAHRASAEVSPQGANAVSATRLSDSKISGKSEIRLAVKNWTTRVGRGILAPPKNAVHENENRFHSKLLNRRLTTMDSGYNLRRRVARPCQ
jgi:hypothetical protein